MMIKYTDKDCHMQKTTKPVIEVTITGFVSPYKRNLENIHLLSAVFTLFVIPAFVEDRGLEYFDAVPDAGGNDTCEAYLIKFEFYLVLV